MQQSAVITGDLIDSTKMPAVQRQWLVTRIQESLQGWDETFGMKSELFRGDSFQSLLPPPMALRVALIQKTFIRSLSLSATEETGTANNDETDKKDFSRMSYDARIAIGIGPVEADTQSLATAGGTAFELSGQLLDSMKGRKLSLAVATNDAFKDELATECTLLDALLAKSTAAQCEVIYYKLTGLTEQQIADTLSIAQSAVNQRSISGSWNAIDVLLKRFEQIYTHE